MNLFKKTDGQCLLQEFQPGFDPILQKLCQIICEVIFSKMVCGIYLNFCFSRSVNNFVVKNNFYEPLKYQQLNILRPIYF